MLRSNILERILLTLSLILLTVTPALAGFTPTPSATPTVSPTAGPSGTPTAIPTASPTPSATPTAGPSGTPTAIPTVSPTPSASPTAAPTGTPTVIPTVSPTPTASPTGTPTTIPTPTANPFCGTYVRGDEVDAGDGPESIAAVDVNDDGIADLVTANLFSDDVTVMLGNGDGSFQAAVSFAAGNSPESVAVVDVNGDDIPDIVTANNLSNDVSVLLGNGDGSFQAAVSYAVGDAPRSVAVADFNGDTFPDVATANFDSDDVSVLLGVGDGSFQEAVSYAAGDGPSSVAAGNLNGGSDADLVTTNFLDDNVSVLLGNGDGSFQAAVPYAVSASPESVVVADLDDDSVPDLAVAAYADSDSNGNNTDTGDVNVLLGNGDGSFQAATPFAVGDFPFSVVVANLDDNDIPDLATANFGSGDVSVLLGNGDGSFQNAFFPPAGVSEDGDGPTSIAAATLDNDTDTDLVTTNRLPDEVTPIFNLCTSPTPEPTATPTSTPGPTPVPAPLTKAQQTCVNEMNKSGEKVNKAQFRDNEKCLTDFQGNKLGEQTFDECTTADRRNKVEAAQESTEVREGRKCDPLDLPRFGYNGSAAVNAAGVDGGLALLHKLFGGPPVSEINLVKRADGKDTAKCQLEMLKRTDKVENTVLKELNKAKKKALRDPTVTDSPMLEDALWSVFDSNDKITKAQDALVKGVDKKCAAVETSFFFVFPGDCRSVNLNEVEDCANAAARCEACLKVNAFDALGMNCDLADDNSTNGSCP